MHGVMQDADSSSSPVADARSTADRFAAFRTAFWKFLRPHTIRGTILGATAVTSRALLENQQVWACGAPQAGFAVAKAQARCRVLRSAATRRAISSRVHCDAGL